ncbi:MAG TPA: cytochrome c-type biogenesis CcmF C-terminal domain-containing protein, partial [Ilumatobacteraceae bacterium]|nr:cytochrome c-type biogenesis CcmF C-terminal domain-containing protein [Ilumatobacteraceae bacterium]
GDKLRSPGTLDSPISREGAFLANNVLFAGFAFVVLLGTVFPLIVEAWNNQQISVGRPYFDRMTSPVALLLLFLMAVAPALPWRKASAELLRTRLQWPAWIATLTVVVCVVMGLRGLGTLLAFGLGAFAAAAAVRQLILSGRRQGLRGLLGRANGGMVVHLGVIMIAVALAASNSYTRVAEFTLQRGVPVSYGGHTFELQGLQQFTDARSTGVKALITIDGGKAYAPAITTFTNFGTKVPTPSVRNGPFNDLYLTLEPSVRFDGTEAPVKIFIKPLVVWLWIGGSMMAVGTVLAGFPGRRRRVPTDPVSAPIELEPVSV